MGDGLPVFVAGSQVSLVAEHFFGLAGAGGGLIPQGGIGEAHNVIRLGC
ncbi:MAG: hypothetical protein JST19_05905 [Bacteroidetes bacterium]|nr:hypothetical protein [Bacteroidota bacterium]